MRSHGQSFTEFAAQLPFKFIEEIKLIKWLHRTFLQHHFSFCYESTLHCSHVSCISSEVNMGTNGWGTPPCRCLQIWMSYPLNLSGKTGIRRGLGFCKAVVWIGRTNILPSEFHKPTNRPFPATPHQHNIADYGYGS